MRNIKRLLAVVFFSVILGQIVVFPACCSDSKPIQLNNEEESFRASFLGLNKQHFYFEHDADMSVAAVPCTIKVPYGVFDLDGRNIKGVLEKPTYNYFVNAGFIKKLDH